MGERTREVAWLSPFSRQRPAQQSGTECLSIPVPYSTHWTMAHLWLGPGNTMPEPATAHLFASTRQKWETLEGACGPFIALHCLPHHFPARIKHLIEGIPVPPPPDPTCCPVLMIPKNSFISSLRHSSISHSQSSCTWCLCTAECRGVKPHSPRDYFTHVLGQIIADFKQYKAWV